MWPPQSQGRARFCHTHLSKGQHQMCCATRQPPPPLQSHLARKVTVPSPLGLGSRRRTWQVRRRPLAPLPRLSAQCRGFSRDNAHRVYGLKAYHYRRLQCPNSGPVCWPMPICLAPWQHRRGLGSRKTNARVWGLRHGRVRYGLNRRHGSILSGRGYAR